MSASTKGLRRGLTAVSLAVAALAPLTASASVTQLGFILDSSGSIGAGNWTTIVQGLANSVNSLIPADGTYEISVVTFSSAATLNINSFLVTSAATRSTLAAQIAALPFQAGGTVFGTAFQAMTTALTDAVGVNYGANAVTTASTAAASYVNFATDGVNSDTAAGYAARNAMTAAGIDNISIEGIGSGVNVADLQSNYCYPSPCDSTAPYNFPSQGFYIAVANAAAYESAIANKIRTVTGQTPEPAGLALVGVALLGLVAASRRKQA